MMELRMEKVVIELVLRAARMLAMDRGPWTLKCCLFHQLMNLVYSISWWLYTVQSAFRFIWSIILENDCLLNTDCGSWPIFIAIFLITMQALFLKGVIIFLQLKNGIFFMVINSTFWNAKINFICIDFLITPIKLKYLLAFTSSA